MGELSRTRTLLDKTSGQEFEDVYFEERVSETEEPLHFPDPIAIKRETWEAFGRPDEITVTVEPGDLLNEEEEANG